MAIAAVTRESLARGVQGKPVAWSTGIACFLLGGLVTPAVMLETSSGQPLNTERTYLYLLILVFSAARLSALIARGQPRIGTGVFYLFIYVCLGVAPLAQVATGLSNVILQPSRLPTAAVMVLVACAAFEAGSMLVRFQRREPAIVEETLLHSGRVVAVSIIGVLGSLYYIHSVGLGTLFTNRQDVSNALTPGGTGANGLSTASSLVGLALVVTVGTAPVLVGWVAWTRLLWHTAWRRQPYAWVGWAILTLLNIAVNNPIANSRFWFLTVALGFVFSLRSVGPRMFRWAMILGVVAAVFVFPYADHFRNNAQTRADFYVPSQSVEQTLADKDYDQMTMTANAISWINERGGHTNGAQLASSALFFVPHSVWRGRATDTGVAIGEILPTQNLNLSSPLWVEFWVDFSWVGVIIGFVLVGAAGRVLDGLYVRVREFARAPTGWIEIALPVLVGYEFILLRGPLLQAMSRLAALVVCLLVIRETKHRRRRRVACSAAKSDASCA